MQKSKYFQKKLKDSQPNHLKEVATVCSKKDGFGIIIEVFSDDHGILGDESNPAYAHLKTSSGEYLGKFAITLQPPISVEYVFDCDKNKQIPQKYKEIIIEWAKTKNEDDILGWSALKFAWKALHP